MFLSILQRTRFLLLVLLFSCTPELPPDNGRWILSNGEELVPYSYPWIVTSTFELEEETKEALEWWNERTSRKLFVFSSESYEEWELGIIPVAQKDIGDRLGNCSCRYPVGTLMACKISISLDIKDYLIKRETLKHELGHSLGLQDDPWIPQRLSIMMYKLFPRAPITTQDKFLVITDFDSRNY